MRMQSVRSPLLLTCLSALLALCIMAPPSPELLSAGAPLALATLLIAVLLVVVALAAARAPLALAVRAWHDAAFIRRAPARQCDPDAAGHTRSRAPGVLFASPAR